MPKLPAIGVEFLVMLAVVPAVLLLASCVRGDNPDPLDSVKRPRGAAPARPVPAPAPERPAVRDALERLGSYRGLVRRYNPPFTRSRHEALGPEQLLMARFRPDGVLVPAGR